MTIEKVANGYIVKTALRTEIFLTIEEVFSAALLHFEGKGKYFGGSLYGRVVIESKGSEVEPA